MKKEKNAPFNSIPDNIHNTSEIPLPIIQFIFIFIIIIIILVLVFLIFYPFVVVLFASFLMLYFPICLPYYLLFLAYFRIEKWYPDIEDLTFKTTVIPLLKVEANYITKFR